MSHIPDNAVVGRIEDVVERNGKLYRSQRAREMAARLRDGIHNEVPQFSGKLWERGFRKFPQILWRRYLVEYRIVHWLAKGNGVLLFTHTHPPVSAVTVMGFAFFFNQVTSIQCVRRTT